MSRLLVTEDAIRAAVVAEGLKDLGYQGKVGGWNKWGAWYGSAWTHAYFCAAGWSYCWNMALGEADARDIIGRQTHGGRAPNDRGFIWTVAIIEQHRSRKVLLKNLKPGDALMFRYNSGDNRQGNEVNHVDLVERNFPDRGFMYVIGYNVPKPGAVTGDPSRGGGVYRRQIWYTDKAIVAGLQMDAKKLADRNRAAWSKVQKFLNDFGLGDFQMTGVPGPATKASVLEYAKIYAYSGGQDNPFAILPHMEATMANLQQDIAAIHKKLDAQGKVLDIIKSGVDVVVKGVAIVVQQTTKTSIADAVWTHPLYGFTAHWWLRQGGIYSEDHKNFPADPGSPAWKLLKREAEENNGVATVYLPKTGPVMLTYDVEENVFKRPEEAQRGA